MVVHYERVQTVIIMLCAFRNAFWLPDILKMTEYTNGNGIVSPHEKLICSQQIKTKKNCMDMWQITEEKTKYQTSS